MKRHWWVVAGSLFFAAGCSDAPDLTPGTRIPVFAPERTVVAEMVSVPVWHESAGSVKPRTESRIESRITAQVEAVRVSPGEGVAKGDLLIRLDDRELEARLFKARQALSTAESGKKEVVQAKNAASAAFVRMQADWERVTGYFERKAATKQEVERAEAAFKKATAEVKRTEEALKGAQSRIREAREVVTEAEIALGYATIRAHTDGVILSRLVEPGDLAVPGKPLLEVRTEGGFRVEAHVRERMIGQVEEGARLEARIDTVKARIPAVVEEIVPYADPKSRSFLVKAALTFLPEEKRIYPGMYARLRIPAGTRRVIRIPEEAVTAVGQLFLVTVKEAHGWDRRMVTLGEREDGMVEVLSGLSGGESVGIGEAR